MKSLKTLLYVAVVIALSLGVVREGSALAIQNGSFESGFTSWQTFNLTYILDASYGIAPSNGSYYAQALAQSADPYNAAGVEAFLGVSDSTLQAIKSGYTDFTEGSAFKQTFTANAGDKISFDWKFTTEEEIIAPYDFSFYTLNNGVNTSAFALGDTNIDSGYMVSDPMEYETIGWRRVTITIPTTGIYTLGFGAMQAEDNLTSSALLIDNVTQTTAVPEPSTFLLLGAGMSGIVLLRRKARR
jgi:hypothetical protein